MKKWKKMWEMWVRNKKKKPKKLRLNSVNLKTTSLWTCDLLKNVEHFYDYGHYGDPY